MVFGKERAAWRCGTSRDVRDAARKPTGGSVGNNNFGGPADWEAALRVADAARRRASERLDDAPHRLRRPSYPTGRLRDLYGSLLALLGITTPVGLITPFGHSSR